MGGPRIEEDRFEDRGGKVRGITCIVQARRGK